MTKLSQNAEKARRDVLYVCNKMDSVAETVYKLQQKLDRRYLQLTAETGNGWMAMMACMTLSHHLGQINRCIAQELHNFAGLAQSSCDCADQANQAS